ISKQSSHASLKKLKEKKLIRYVDSDNDRRVKHLYPTEEGSALVHKLNQAQNELLQQTFEEAGTEWHDFMEHLASMKSGFKNVKSIKPKE
ncbi:MarR family transcriptional regulator, partial [Mammaliicoccus sciuri]